MVVAACSPRTLEPLFQDTVREAGINQYYYEMANIREHNSWVHAREKEEATLTEIASDLGIPITSAKYHVEHLLDADIIRIVRTKYSEKGREVKVYGVRDQIVIMNPGTATPTDIRRLLLKYASLFCLLALATLLLTVAYPALLPGDDFTGSLAGGERMNLMTASPQAPETVLADDDGYAMMATKSLPEPDPVPGPASGSAPGPAPAPKIPQSPVNPLVLGFFGGGCLVLLLMVIYEIFFWQRSRKSQKNRQE